MPSSRRIFAVLLVVVLPGPGATAARAQRLTPAEVRTSIDAGVRFIKGRQTPDGSWPDLSQMGGVTALATLALLNAQVPVDDDNVKRALGYLEGVPNRFTYTVSLKIAVFAAADPKRYRREIQDAADWLIRSQMNGGSWGYGNLDPRGAIGGQGDNSNSQYALLGLHEAAMAGAKVPTATWNKARQHWKTTQARDGGWGYLGRSPKTTGSMTAAGVASLIMCGNEVNKSLERGYVNGAAPKCGKYRQDRAVAAGLRWLSKKFSARTNPDAASWHYYWLYGVERAGILSGLRYFGDHDWYREGAEYLVNRQQGGMGGLLGGAGSWNRSVIDTSFAILFLAKGRRPVLINKLEWSDDDQWNPDRHDCENLIAHLGDDLGERVSWQTVDLKASVEEWLQAPILYIQGHQFPKFTEDERAKLRRFVEAGGTLFAEACCSRQPFRRGFERFVQQAFSEYPLRELEPEHPIWQSLHKLRPGRWPLFGLDSGCRTSVIFSPRDLSCLWEQAGVPRLSERAFQLGANIAAYATGQEPLRDKLAEVRLPGRRESGGDDVPVRGALQIAQISHTGDWKPDAQAITVLAELLRREANVTVVSRPVFLKADDLELLDHPIAYLTGHFAFELSADERAALRRYLRRGGFLFAEACCGREAFAKSFQRLMGRLFPEQSMSPIAADHPVRLGRFGYPLDRVAYRPTLAKERPNLTEPELAGLDLDGRTAVIFSRWGIGCGLEDHQCFSCRGVAPADARKIAVNIVLYALTN